MSALVFKFVLIFTVIFSLGGGTVALADNSLPDTPLYPIKMAAEQVRLNLETDPLDQAMLHLVLAQERIQEMVRLAQEGLAPGEAGQQRLETHLNRAMQLAAHLDDTGMQEVLSQARQMLRAQEQVLTRTRMQLSGPPEEPLRQTVQLLNRYGQEVGAGLRDGQAFRWRWLNAGAPPEEGWDQGPGAGPGPLGTPDCTGEACEPQGDQHQYGSQPEQPGPGEPGGNPDCPDGACEPQGDQHQYGPQPEQPGPGKPGPGKPGGKGNG